MSRASKAAPIAILSLTAVVVAGGGALLFSAAEPSVYSASSGQVRGDESSQPGGRALSAQLSLISPSYVVAPPIAPAPPPPPEAAPVAEEAPAPAAVRSASPEEAALASTVVAIVNQKRAENGCGPVAEDAGLGAVAFSHSADMGTRNYFSHDTLEGLSPWDRAAAAGQSAGAENIAAGQPTAESAMDSWMNSQGHRDNILNCNHTRLGVGVAQGSGDYGIYWTQLFG